MCVRQTNGLGRLKIYANYLCIKSSLLIRFWEQEVPKPRRPLLDVPFKVSHINDINHNVCIHMQWMLDGNRISCCVVHTNALNILLLSLV